MLAGGSLLALTLVAFSKPASAAGNGAGRDGGFRHGRRDVYRNGNGAGVWKLHRSRNAASSTVSVTCTNSTPYTLSLGAGSGTGATTTNRSMTGGGVSLGYGLFSDSAHTTNFDATASITANGAAQPATVYRQIPAGEYVAPGSYTDTVTARLTY